MRRFYGRLEKCVPSAGKTDVHKIPRLGGGGGILGSGGGGSANFIFMGARIFLIKGTRQGGVIFPGHYAC